MQQNRINDNKNTPLRWDIDVNFEISQGFREEGPLRFGHEGPDRLFLPRSSLEQTQNGVHKLSG